MKYKIINSCATVSQSSPSTEKCLFRVNVLSKKKNCLIILAIIVKTK